MALTGTGWRKSSHSNGGQQGSCVEVARHPAGGIAVRDSKDPDGPILTIEPAGWRDFIAHVKAGRRGLT